MDLKVWSVAFTHGNGWAWCSGAVCSLVVLGSGMLCFWMSKARREHCDSWVWAGCALGLRTCAPPVPALVSRYMGTGEELVRSSVYFYTVFSVPPVLVQVLITLFWLSQSIFRATSPLPFSLHFFSFGIWPPTFLLENTFVCLPWGWWSSFPVLRKSEAGFQLLGHNAVGKICEMSHLFFSGVCNEEVNALLRAHCWVILRMTLVNITYLDSRFKSCLLYQLIADLCDVFCVLEARQGQSDKMSLLGVCPPGFLQ